MSFVKEFKEFALRGNVVDMAVGVIIGAAFGKIVSSLVADVITPVLGKILGDVDFTSLFYTLSGNVRPESLASAKEMGIATLNYGVFLQATFDFAIIAFVLFLAIRTINRMKRTEPAPAPPPDKKDCVECLSPIPIKARRCAHCTAVLA